MNQLWTNYCHHFDCFHGWVPNSGVSLYVFLLFVKQLLLFKAAPLYLYCICTYFQNKIELNEICMCVYPLYTNFALKLPNISGFFFSFCKELLYVDTYLKLPSHIAKMSLSLIPFSLLKYVFQKYLKRPFSSGKSICPVRYKSLKSDMQKKTFNIALVIYWFSVTECLRDFFYVNTNKNK